MRIEQLSTLSTSSIKNWAINAQKIICSLVTNGYQKLSSVALETAVYDHVVVRQEQLNELRCFRWVNTTISNIKKAIKCSYDGFKVSKQPQLFLAGPQYRLNSRFNSEALLTILIYTSIKNNPRFLNWIKAEESCF